MTARAVRITSRIIFVICGLVSMITGVAYVLLRGVDLPVQSEWVIFAVVLEMVGVLGVAVGLLPRSGALRLCFISQPWSLISPRMGGILIHNSCWRRAHFIS
jgi:uncharacterized membrane protein YphA (DoxX/SURF4 family)